jgi:hypothetical protein
MRARVEGELLRRRNGWQDDEDDFGKFVISTNSPAAAVLLGRLPSDETPGVSSLGCALVAVRACLWVLL